MLKSLLQRLGITRTRRFPDPMGGDSRVVTKEGFATGLKGAAYIEKFQKRVVLS